MFGGPLGFLPVKVKQVDTSPFMSMGQNFMNPNSQQNLGMYRNLKGMGVDAAAQQYLGGMRMQGAGQNPFANEQWKSGLSDALGQTQNTYNSYLTNAYGIGSGLMGQGLQGDMANANAINQSRMYAAQNKNSFWGGLLSSALQASPFFMFPNALGGGKN